MTLYIITQAEWGGAGKHVFNLATDLAAQNKLVMVAAGNNGEQTLLTKLAAQNIKIKALAHLVRPISPFHDLLAIFELKKFYQELKPEIVHLHSTKAGVVGSLAFWLWTIGRKFPANRPQLLYTVHGWVFNEPNNWWKNKIYLWLEKFTARFKDKIICVSEFDRQAALKNKIAPAEKLITIHNRLAPDAIDFLPREQARQKLGLTSIAPAAATETARQANPIIVGAIANFYATKGLAYLIEAAKIFIDETAKKMAAAPEKAMSENIAPPIIFAVIGDGELRPELEKMIRDRGLEKNFFLLGRRENAAQYLKAFDLFVLPSVKEGLPYALLEAQAADLPIVATAVGGVPEILTTDKQPKNFLAEPKNPRDLAEKIKTALMNTGLINTNS